MYVRVASIGGSVLPHMRILAHTRMGRPIRVWDNIRIWGRTAVFNSTRTDETALYNLNNVAHAFVMHIDRLSRARRIVSAWLESHRSLESSVT